MDNLTAVLINNTDKSWLENLSKLKKLLNHKNEVQMKFSIHLMDQG
jgi:phage-related protein